MIVFLLVALNLSLGAPALSSVEEIPAPPPSEGYLGHELVGKWRYFKKIYRGHEMPEPPEASLRLFFEFHLDGTSRLYWWHEGEGDWCERLGRYRIEGSALVDRVTWVNPRNSQACSKDPDMQMGRETTTPVVIRSNEWELHMNLGDDTLVYVWQRELP